VDDKLKEKICQEVDSALRSTLHQYKAINLSVLNMVFSVFSVNPRLMGRCILYLLTSGLGLWLG
jgi:hypothetical protein